MAMPDDLEHVRTTPVFDADTVPPGLLRAHRVAEGVWGRLVVHTGEVVFLFEDGDGEQHLVAAGSTHDIPPGRPHHLEIGESATFAVEFFK